MGLFYIGLVAAIFFIILAIFSAILDWDNGFCIGALFGGVLVIVLVISGLSLVNKEARWKSYIFEYENTRALVETYSGSDYGNMTDLTEKMLQINDRIAAHRAYTGNKLVGAWYSEEVGNLEPLTFNYTNTRTEKEEKIPLPAE